MVPPALSSITVISPSFSITWSFTSGRLSTAVVSVAAMVTVVAPSLAAASTSLSPVSATCSGTVRAVDWAAEMTTVKPARPLFSWTAVGLRCKKDRSGAVGAGSPWSAGSTTLTCAD